MATQKETKIPQQERGILKRKQIIDSGFALFCKQGYYHTNTAEIAKAAGVSTGIVYRYFPDKKAIFLEGLSKFMNESMDNVHDRLVGIESITDFPLFLSNLINELVEMHVWGREVHEELNMMVHSDAEIRTFYYEWEEKMTRIVMEVFPQTGHDDTNKLEKVHMIIQMCENYCHEVAFHKHKDMNYDVMKQMVIKSIMFILELS